MARQATRRKLKTYVATMHVTRLEQWAVEAASEEEARRLLATFGGSCSHVGECLHAEVETLERD